MEARLGMGFRHTWVHPEWIEYGKSKTTSRILDCFKRHLGHFWNNRRLCWGEFCILLGSLLVLPFSLAAHIPWQREVWRVTLKRDGMYRGLGDSKLFWKTEGAASARSFLIHATFMSYISKWVFCCRVALIIVSFGQLSLTVDTH